MARVCFKSSAFKSPAKSIKTENYHKGQKMPHFKQMWTTFTDARNKCLEAQHVLENCPGSVRIECRKCKSQFWRVPLSRRSFCCECQAEISYERGLQRQERKRKAKTAELLKPLPGYPRTTPFRTMDEITVYLADKRIVCLLCGRRFAGLGIHIEHLHKINAREYKETFGIPVSYGLGGEDLKDHQSQMSQDRIALMPPKDLQQHIALMRSKLQNSDRYNQFQSPPAIKALRGKIAIEMGNSPKQVRHSKERHVIPCSGCGAPQEVSALVAVTKACVIKCRKCHRLVQGNATKRWREQNPGRTQEWILAYRAALQGDPELLRLYRERYPLKRASRTLHRVEAQCSG